MFLKHNVQKLRYSILITFLCDLFSPENTCLKKICITICSKYFIVSVLTISFENCTLERYFSI